MYVVPNTVDGGTPQNAWGPKDSLGTAAAVHTVGGPGRFYDRRRRAVPPIPSGGLLSAPSPAHPVPRGAFTAAYHYYCTRHDYRIAPSHRRPATEALHGAFGRATHENKLYVTHSRHTVTNHMAFVQRVYKRGGGRAVKR